MTTFLDRLMLLAERLDEAREPDLERDFRLPAKQRLGTSGIAKEPGDVEVTRRGWSDGGARLAHPYSEASKLPQRGRGPADEVNRERRGAPGLEHVDQRHDAAGHIVNMREVERVFRPVDAKLSPEGCGSRERRDHTVGVVRR